MTDICNNCNSPLEKVETEFELGETILFQDFTVCSNAFCVFSEAENCLEVLPK